MTATDETRGSPVIPPDGSSFQPVQHRLALGVEDDRAERGDYVGCIAGALSTSEYRTGLLAAGFVDVEITTNRAVADDMHSAIIRAGVA